jgi:2-iminoacetate synthase ThiH
MKARVLVTQKCQNDCSYCCNKSSSLLKKALRIGSLDDLCGRECTEIIITGGEPSLYPGALEDLIRDVFCGPKLYLYTTIPPIKELLPRFNGITFTKHTDSLLDLVSLRCMEAYAMLYHEISFRLRIGPNTAAVYHPYLWHDVMRVSLSAECPLPEGEDLFILDPPLEDR